MNSMFIPIETHTIRSGSIHSFDLFFRTKEEKMVLYCTAGERVDNDIREKLRKLNSDNLYIHTKDKEYYSLYLEESLPYILKESQVTSQVKAKTAYNSVISIARTLFESPKSEIIKRYKNVIFSIVQYIFDDDEAFHNLIQLTTFDFTVYNHSINVGLIGTGLARELLGDKPGHDFAEMAKGFFLHDIGKSVVPLGILHKREPLSYDEWELLKRHPRDGLRILAQFNEQSETINLIVAQHHERHNGKGYPKGLKGDQIHIYSKICSIADTFDGLTSNRPYRKKYLTFHALKIMKNEIFKYCDPEFFRKFVKLFSTYLANGNVG